ncbi:hypothetical protein RGUI_0297 [Rhodovulum sp. P5]|uniref:PAS domain-containing protein n=1 Tax=Rhodovulum sp. P5 TaxID=1564506 RepID=UPI0009C37867|nr:PAS domain-containing protein [Rhodovulum sp. P5]ARE38438.1 hypothetical protein RGUI_0297 [Rhodovulum sp. P5]
MADIEKSPRAAVISIAGYRKSGELAALDEVEAYWSSLRETNGSLPTRAQLEPRGFARALSNCFVAEAIAPHHLRLRLAGQHLHELMGMEMRGMPLSALVLPESRPQLQKTIGELLSDMDAPVRLRLISPRSYGRQALFAGMLLLPLAPEAGSPQRVLGAIATVGTVGWTPRRFQILGVGEEQVRPERQERPALRVIEGGVVENA